MDHGPIFDRIDHVGGIESITLDGTRYFFGYDFCNDLVISPLIDDMDAMAAFACRYMEQMDGKHDAEYWRELAEDAVTYTDLACDDEDRDFTSQQMRDIVAQLKAIATRNQPAVNLPIEYHMLFLLQSACGDIDALVDNDMRSAFQGIGLSLEEGILDCVDDCIDFMNGKANANVQGSYRDVAIAVQKFLATLAARLPDNWKTTFAPLTAEFQR